MFAEAKPSRRALHQNTVTLLNYTRQITQGDI
jgi:hypothetical protein